MSVGLGRSPALGRIAPNAGHSNMVKAVAKLLSTSSISGFLEERLPPKSLLLGCNHLSKGRGYARFKLKVEEKAEKRAGEEEVGSSEKESGTYLRNHPYRQIDAGWKSKSELSQLLVENQIHNDHGLFVSNKPFGVGVRIPNPKSIQLSQKYGDSNLHLRGLPSCAYTLEDLLPELRRLLGKPSLVLCRSVEKFASGPAIFCDDPSISERFSKCVASSKVYFDTLYCYHVVTVLPPLLWEQDGDRVERLGITIKKGLDTDAGQAVVQHVYSKNSVKHREVVSVHCRAEILQKSAGTSACLVELNTSSVAKNFLRVYCADKLAPVLGDNLYSARVQIVKGVPLKVDPMLLRAGTQVQKISQKIQACLELRKPEDAIMVPLHAHLRKYKVRGFLPGDKKAVMEIEAPYPPYFRWTCQQLGMILDADSSPIINHL